jgi:hypothetical protein
MSSDASPLSAARTRTGTEDPPQVSRKRRRPNTSAPSDRSLSPAARRSTTAEPFHPQREREHSQSVPTYDTRFSAEREYAMEGGVAQDQYDGDENSLPEVSEDDYDSQESGAEQSAGQSGEGQSDDERDDEDDEQDESTSELDEVKEESPTNEWSAAEEPPTKEQLDMGQAIFEVLAEGPVKTEGPVEEPSTSEKAFASAIVDALIYDGCIIPEVVPESRKRGASSTCSEPNSKRRRYDVPPPWAEKCQWGPIRDMEPWVPKRRRQSNDFQADEILRYKVPQLERRGPTAATRPNGIHPIHIRPGERPWEATRPKGMEWSLDNAVPYNDITREVSNFLFGNVVDAPPMNIGKLEVEARLGVLMDVNTGQRISIPISTEAVITPGASIDTRFESLMSRASFPPQSKTSLTTAGPAQAAQRVPQHRNWPHRGGQVARAHQVPPRARAGHLLRRAGRLHLLPAAAAARRAVAQPPAAARARDDGPKDGQTAGQDCQVPHLRY